MLRHRVITAVILIPLFVWGTLSLPTRYFALMTGVVVALGMWEWSALVRMTPAGRIVHVTAGAVMMAAAYFYVIDTKALYALLAVVVIWWAFSLLWMFSYNRRPEPVSNERVAPRDDMSARAPWVYALVGWVVLVPAWFSLVALHESRAYGPNFVLFLFVLIWLADTSAYFSGRLWGRAKLAPGISPGKTWMGIAGALWMTLLVSAAGGVILGLGWDKSRLFALIGLFTAVASVAGDLFESMFKRRAGVKDSGTLLPGHGGVLDRIDSLTAAAPVFLFGLLAAGISH